MLSSAQRSCWTILHSGPRLRPHHIPKTTILQYRFSSQQPDRSVPLRTAPSNPQSSDYRNPDLPPFKADRLNPPSTVYPPPLKLPFWDPSKPHYKNYFELGKAYLFFYKAGFKQIKANINLIRFHSTLPTLGRKRDNVAAVKAGRVTRSEYRVHQSMQDDMSKLPLFGLLFCITGEFTPLLVPFLSVIVPKTLWLPTQVEKARRKAKERVRRISPKADEDAVHYVAGKDSYESALKVEDVGAEKARKARIAAGVAINAWPRLWDPLTSNVLPMSLLVRRLRRKAEVLRLDDMAIERDGGVKKLSEREVRRAVQLRGVHEKDDEEDLREILEKCIKINKRYWGEDMKGPTAKEA